MTVRSRILKNRLRFSDFDHKMGEVERAARVAIATAVLDDGRSVKQALGVLGPLVVTFFPVVFDGIAKDFHDSPSMVSPGILQILVAVASKVDDIYGSAARQEFGDEMARLATGCVENMIARIYGGETELARGIAGLPDWMKVMKRLASEFPERAGELSNSQLHFWNVFSAKTLATGATPFDWNDIAEIAASTLPAATSGAWKALQRLEKLKDAEGKDVMPQPVLLAAATTFAAAQGRAVDNLNILVSVLDVPHFTANPQWDQAREAAEPLRVALTAYGSVDPEGMTGHVGQLGKMLARSLGNELPFARRDFEAPYVLLGLMEQATISAPMPHTISLLYAAAAECLNNTDFGAEHINRAEDLSALAKEIKKRYPRGAAPKP